MCSPLLLSLPPRQHVVMNHIESPTTASTKNGRPLYSLYRLRYDLDQLADDLPRGIRVVTDDADMYVLQYFSETARFSCVFVRSRFCLILEPQEGYLEGCRIHLSISVPDHWPCVPLSAKIDTPVSHVSLQGLRILSFSPLKRIFDVLAQRGRRLRLLRHFTESRVAFLISCVSCFHCPDTSVTFFPSDNGGYSPAYSLAGTLCV